MWVYEKRLQFPVNIRETNAKLAQAIISQYGGADGQIYKNRASIRSRTIPDPSHFHPHPVVPLYQIVYHHLYLHHYLQLHHCLY